MTASERPLQELLVMLIEEANTQGGVPRTSGRGGVS